jgi:hypothetical protein
MHDPEIIEEDFNKLVKTKVHLQKIWKILLNPEEIST